LHSYLEAVSSGQDRNSGEWKANARFAGAGPVPLVAIMGVALSLGAPRKANLAQAIRQALDGKGRATQ
jgi:hypothetical protein